MVPYKKINAKPWIGYIAAKVRRYGERMAILGLQHALRISPTGVFDERTICSLNRLTSKRYIAYVKSQADCFWQKNMRRLQK